MLDVFHDDYHFLSLPFQTFLKKIQQYHDETAEPIYFSMRLPSPLRCPEELKQLCGMKERLQPHHLDLVHQYLPRNTVKTARHNYFRSQYYKSKLKVGFVMNAILQIQEFDPFYITMDEIHHSDHLMMELISEKQFYEEKILNLPLRNELSPS